MTAWLTTSVRTATDRVVLDLRGRGRPAVDEAIDPFPLELTPFERYMLEDDRESFDECCRHLIRFALKIKLGGGASNGQVVERRDGKEQIPNWTGLERRKGSR